MVERKDSGSLALGQFLAAQRLARGLSYRQMAGRFGKAPSTIQSWELGKRLPGLDDLYALAYIFNFSLSDLVTMATLPVKNLEKLLASAEESYRKSRPRKEKKDPRSLPYDLSPPAREVTFLRNVIAGKKKEEELPARLNLLRTVPIAGSIKAGRSRVVQEDISGYAGVPGGLDVDYALTVEGDSMTGAGILPGDQVLVRKTGAAESGDTVVALLGGIEVTVKHLVGEDSGYLLRSNNPQRDYPDIPLGPEDMIIGVVQRVVKRPVPPPKRSAEVANV